MNWLRFIGCLGITFAVGCSSDGDSGSSSTSLNKLSASELKTQCEATKADFDSLARGSCILDARSSSDCAAAAQACADASSVDCDNINVDDVADCTVTVGELKSCLSQTAAYFSGISCDKAPAGSPPTCMQSVASKCSLFGG